MITILPCFSSYEWRFDSHVWWWGAPHHWTRSRRWLDSCSKTGRFWRRLCSNFLHWVYPIQQFLGPYAGRWQKSRFCPKFNSPALEQSQAVPQHVREAASGLSFALLCSTFLLYCSYPSKQALLLQLWCNCTIVRVQSLCGCVHSEVKSNLSL